VKFAQLWFCTLSEFFGTKLGTEVQNEVRKEHGLSNELLLTLASTVILGSKPRGSLDNISCSTTLGMMQKKHYEPLYSARSSETAAQA
jgi:hypothetical protein